MSSHSQAGASILQKRKSTRPVAVFWNTKVKASTTMTAATINFLGNLPRLPDFAIKSLPFGRFHRFNFVGLSAQHSQCGGSDAHRHGGTRLGHWFGPLVRNHRLHKLA